VALGLVDQKALFEAVELVENFLSSTIERFC